MAVKTDKLEREDELVPTADRFDVSEPKEPLVPFPTEDHADGPQERVQEKTSRPRKERKQLPPEGKNLMKRFFKSPIFLIVVVIICGVIWSFSLRRCISSAKRAYAGAKAESKQYVSDSIANASYDLGKRRFYTSGRAAINVDDIEEMAKLEVLKVSTVVYFTVGENENRYIEARGSSVYTVDLKAGEYICDDANRHVLVRVPEPELASNPELEKVTLLSGKVKGTSTEGVEQGLSDNENASRIIEKTFKHNQAYSEMAEDAARTLIPALLRGLNSDIPDLTVDIQFVS